MRGRREALYAAEGCGRPMEDDRVRIRLERVADVIRRFVEQARPAVDDRASLAPDMLSANSHAGGRSECTDDVRCLMDACMLIEEVMGEYERSTLAQRSPQHYLFRLEGQYWTICYEREVFRLRDSKGLRYLCWLMRQPGQEVLACDLVAIESAPRPLPSPFQQRGEPGCTLRRHGGTLGDAGPHLDAHARAEYRRRLRELQEELEEARSFNDSGRCDRIEHELAWLGHHLAEAAHRGGAARASSATERARVNVKNNLTSALNAIRQFDLDLWRHLFNALKTGTFCVYEPERRVMWTLDSQTSDLERNSQRTTTGRARPVARSGGG